ncbi:hypothetical protein DOC71_00435 [Salmonella enterica subsp. enterica]|nr:hypothetical protein [Salmonella enterica subsp. enterica serovar Falkensee]EAA6072667.1 hypothetical protein [Salmonella enterica subsp. enterica serovar Corvallis]EAS4119018.1 hypothetical protein [Salmonella enterica]EAW1947719.1 hypothetical protein [Salmonella enterica subsp. enterica]EBV7175173.1 hypothetical protein [Salmonella enterica subsp. enterica serovar Thompson]EBX8123448.1 hypothetical protein [Salmonella enterica subsp. enterica serovar Tyresoe]ECU9009045.1 hypothetical pr
MQVQRTAYIKSKGKINMDSYSNPFLFEMIYFIISILFLITFICYRIYFKSEKSRAVLFFSTFPIGWLHYTVADHGMSFLLKTLDSSHLFMFDESFIRNMALIFFLLHMALTFNLFWRSNIRRFK